MRKLKSFFKESPPKWIAHIVAQTFQNRNKAQEEKNMAAAADISKAVEPLIDDYKTRRRRELWGNDKQQTVESLQNSLSSMCGRAGAAERLAEHYRLRNVELSQKVIEFIKKIKQK